MRKSRRAREAALDEETFSRQPFTMDCPLLPVELVMNADSKPSFPAASRLHGSVEHRAEFYISLGLALLTLLGILFASTVLVAVDISGLQVHIDRFFEVSMTPAVPQDHLPPHYSAETVVAKQQRLLHEAKANLFSSTPKTGSSRPEVKELLAASLPAILPEKQGSPTTSLPPDVLTPVEREVTGDQVALAVPVVIRRTPREKTRTKEPDPAALYLSGREGGGGPGRPFAGSERPVFSDRTLPDAPAIKTLPPAPLPPVIDEEVRILAQHSHVLLDSTPEGNYPSLDQDVNADFSIYGDEATGNRYFRLILSLKPESVLATIPQDVFFLLDASQSVSDSEYAVLRESAIKHLRRLHPLDRFNLALFSENTYFFADDFQEASRVASLMEKIEKFTIRDYRERTTDVFTALNQVLARLSGTGRPVSFFLLTDGNATQGVADVKSLVQGLSRVNRNNFAIHSFNAGEGGDRYLLELLSYRSRGFFMEERSLSLAGEKFSAFSTQFNEPVLTNLVLSYSNMEPDEIYPGVLPSLYRNHPVVIYGRGQVGKNIILRVAGFHGKDPREFYFRAIIPEGGSENPEVEREWAIGKCHALMARFSQEPRNQALKEEIVGLAKAYSLPAILEMVESRRVLAPIRKVLDRRPAKEE